MALPSQAMLIIGHHFPEPSTTAAGSRMMQIISIFQEANFNITFATTATTSTYSADLQYLGITVNTIQLNDASFDTFIAKIQPSIVLFDRYITEEQFGWRVSEVCPQALTILDTEDLHFLRKAREQAFKKEGHLTHTYLFSDTAKREIASILRCDMSLIISHFEMELLTTTFKVASEVLFYLPFLLSNIPTLDKAPQFKDRDGFMTIGNLHHAPNVDAVVYLKKEIWPAIKKQLPKATLSIYGMYAPPHIQKMHNEAQGFLIKGWAPSVKTAFHTAKVCVAPLRFGAGLKGKIVDAFQYGTPVITSPIGAEGIFHKEEIPSSFAHHTQDFIKKAITLYNHPTQWKQNQREGHHCVTSKFTKALFVSSFMERIEILQRTLEKHRQDHFIGQILQHQSLQSTKYMSKWIEVKNSK